MADFDWFTDWAWSQIIVTITFVRGMTEQELATALGASTMTVSEAPVEDIARSNEHLEKRVRLGRVDKWVYAVEGVTTEGYARLEPLSADGRDACVFCHTQGISLLLFARNGETVGGLDLIVPNHRFGLNEHYLDAVLAQLGIPVTEPAYPVQAARLIEAVYSLEITQDMLDRPLPSLTLESRL